MSQRNAWIALFALLGLMLAASCGGNGATSTKPSAESGPPAFQGEPDYQKVPITGAKEAGLSDQDARDLLRWTVRFANHLWTFDAGQTGGQERQKVWPFYTPRQQARLPRPNDQEARTTNSVWKYQSGRQRLTWASPPLAAALEKSTSKEFPGDITITADHAQTIAEVAGPQARDTAVAQDVQKVAGHWRVDAYNAYVVGGSFKRDEEASAA